MGLQADIQKDIAEAFNTDLADAVTSFLYVKKTLGDYDPASGDPIDYRTEVQTRGVIQPVSKGAIDGETVVVSDVEFLILSNEIATVPEIGQTFLVGAITYHINTVNIDPASAMWTVVARAV